MPVNDSDTVQSVSGGKRFVVLYLVNSRELLFQGIDGSLYLQTVASAIYQGVLLSYPDLKPLHTNAFRSM